MKKSVVIINGKKIEFNGNAIINIKRDTSYVEKMDIDDNTRMIIEINGNIGDLTCNNCNVLINGNSGSVKSDNGKIECNDIYGDVISLSTKCKTINGNLNTYNDIIVENLKGDIYNKDNVFTNIKPLTKMSDFKKGVEIYHISYGKGQIVYKLNTNYTKTITIEFESEEYRKILNLDSIIKNKSIFKLEHMKNINKKELQID